MKAGVTILHNPQCSKSREALALLQEKGIEPEIRLYLKEPLTETELKSLLKKLRLPASDLVRTNEELFKELYKGQTHTEEEWVKILAEHPRLMERAVVVAGNRAVIARPVEKILTILPEKI